MMKKMILFAAIMGSITTGIISITLISLNTGFVSGFIMLWIKSWFISYLIAVPAIVIIAPRVQSLLNKWAPADDI